MDAIPFCEPFVASDYGQAVKDQVDSGWWGPGPKTNDFAQQLAKKVGSPNCALTTSGTIALSVAAEALGLQPGDEILVPAYGVVSTINAFASFRLQPRLVDLNPLTGSMDPDDLVRRISPRTKAVCFVNFSGYTGPDLLKIKAICNARNIPLIEDAACALGQSLEGRSAGTFGTIGTYSFSVPKIITTGQGGALVTESKELFDKIQCFLDQGDLNWRKTNSHEGVGSNLRYNDIQSAMGLAQLNRLNELLGRKSACYRAYREALGASLFTIPGTIGPLHYVVFSPERETIAAKLREQKIFPGIQYRALYDHTPFKTLREGSYPGSEFWNKFALYLPFGLALKPEQVARIVEVLKPVRGQLLDLQNWKSHA